MKKIIACISIICYTLLCYSQNQTTDNNYRTQKNISYLHPGEKDSYKLERCKLDLHYPTDKKGFATLIWFHGGGLEAGEKHFPKEFLEQGYAVIAVNYRLSPRAQNPAYTEDAAEAVAWTFENIEEFGGDKDKIYIAGHSAGGYLCLMLNLDKSTWQSGILMQTAWQALSPSADRPPLIIPSAKNAGCLPTLRL